MIKPLEAARQLADWGFVVLPAKYQGKAPTVDWKSYQTEPPDGEALERFFSSVALSNYWVLCGAPSRIVVLDCDNKEAIAWAHLEIGTDILEATPTVKTSKGQHFYFRLEDGQQVPQWNMHTPDGPSLDVRSDGGGVIAPPSIHKSGVVYRWLRTPDEGWQPVPEILLKPQGKAKLARTEGQSPARSTLAALLADPPAKGSRNDWLAKVAGHYAKQLTHYDAYLQSVQLASTVTKPPLPEWRKVADSIWQAEQQRPATATPDRYTDTGNARRFALMHAGDVYNVAGTWLVYDANRGIFAADKTALAERVRSTIAEIYDEARACDDAKERSRVTRWADYTASARGIRALLEVAETMPGIAAESDEFDADPYLLAVHNGVLDLHDATLRPHDKALRMTKRAGCAFDPDASAPLWDSHIDRIFGGDVDLIRFMQRWLGRSLTGRSPSDNCRIMLAYGTGANGKTVTVEAVSSVLGDYAASADFMTFCAAHSTAGAPRSDLTRLSGVRLVTATESGYHHKLDEALLKQYTGGEKVSPRGVYARQATTYRPQFSLLLSTNHEPRLEGADRGFWRRFLKVGFDVTIPTEEQDAHLHDKLSKELPGILNWLVAGALAWDVQGLDEPLRVRLVTDQYRDDIDIVGQFVRETLIKTPDESVEMTDVYQRYESWAMACGIKRPLTVQQLSGRLVEHGLERSQHPRTRRSTLKDVAFSSFAGPESSFAGMIAERYAPDSCEG